MQRLKAEGSLGQQSWASDVDTCRGSISISNISVPLKHEFLQRGMKGESAATVEMNLKDNFSVKGSLSFSDDGGWLHDIICRIQSSAEKNAIKFAIL